MTTTIHIEGKVLGQKRPVFSDWRVELPPVWERSGDHMKLRDLISHLVAEEVQAFQARQQERRLARITSQAEIEQGARQGKVDPGERDLKQTVILDEAIAAAWQAFEDGLYFVFIDEVQQTGLDKEVYLKLDSQVTLIRLVALAGG